MADAHLLDGMLGRALDYAGLALIASPALWQVLTRSAGPHRRLVLGGTLSATAGALISLHAVTLMAFSPFVPDNSSALEIAELDLGLGDYHQVLSSSAFGKAWLLHVLTLLAAALISGHGRMTCAKAWTSLILAGISAAGLAFMGHAGEYGWQSWLYMTDLLHLGAALTWLAGLSMLTVDRLGGYGQIDLPAIGRFSRLAGWLMAGAMASGLLRLYLQGVSRTALLEDIYGWVLAGKLLALVSVLLSAWSLRRWLATSEGMGNPPWRRFDDRLSAEFFFAAVLILMAALLTQLPPPPPDPVPATPRYLPSG
ncbi:CopD family protein [Thermithiobacillus plumbiphilus]|uniref:CopD family protein n=1 Tax=Thermithiobacillus plumbiphilus TaxID=1729899 RepID=A0ABU9DAH7_9PROT